MSDSNYHVGDYARKTTGNMSLSCEGELAAFQAVGQESVLSLSATQTVGVFSGDAMAVVESTEPGAGNAGLSVGAAGSIKLAAGEPAEGVMIRLQGPELLEMSVGDPVDGASILMTPESITFKVAETTLTLTAAGIVENVDEVSREVTAEGHNFTAAETEMNIGVQGFAQEGPTDASEVEGGTLENETLGSHTTDALKNEDAGIAMEI